MLLLAPVSHDADGVINGTIVLLRWRQSTWGATWPLWSCDANSIINGTISFLRSRCSKSGATWLLTSCNAIGTSIGITWHHGIINGTMAWLKWGATWLLCHLTPLVPALATYHANGAINGTTTFLRSRKLNWDGTWLLVMCIYWHWHYMTPMAHETDASTGTSTNTKGHIITLNHQPNTKNAMVLRVPSTSCYCYVHNKNLYSPKMSQKPQSHSCPHITLPYQLNAMFLLWPYCNQQCIQEFLYTCLRLLAYAPEQTWMPHCTYVFQWTATVVYTKNPHYCTYM